MKRLLLLTVALFCLGALTAQSTLNDVRLRIGSTSKTKSSYKGVAGIGMAGGLYFCRLVGLDESTPDPANFQPYSIITVDGELSVTKSVDLGWERGEEEIRNEFILPYRGEIQYFISVRDPKLKKITLQVMTVDSETLEADGEPVDIYSVDYSKTAKYKNTVFHYVYSPDSSKFMIWYGLITKDNMLATYGYKVFEYDFSKVTELIDQVPGKDAKVFTLEDFALTNGGDVYLLSRIFDGEKVPEIIPKLTYDKRLGRTAWAERPVWSYALFCFSKFGGKPKQFSLALDQKFVRTVRLSCDPDGRAVCAGLYAGAGLMSPLGCCSFVYDPASEKMNSAYKAFDNSTITKNAGTAEAGKITEAIKVGKDYEKYDYDILPLVFRRDGGFWMGAEQVSTKAIKNTSRGEVYVDYVYNLDMLYLINFAPDGSVLWTNSLAKKTKFTDTDEEMTSPWGSAALFGQKDRLFVIWNSFGSDEYTAEEATPMVTVYDAGGKEQSGALSSEEKLKVALCPRSGILIDPVTYRFMGKDGNLLRFAELTF
jgi:hypothetical protein